MTVCGDCFPLFVNKGGRHHHESQLQEADGADGVAFTAQGGEPQDGSKRAGHGEIGAEIHPDEDRTGNLVPFAFYRAIPATSPTGGLLTRLAATTTTAPAIHAVSVSAPFA
jgi:hypothetical protein